MLMVVVDRKPDPHEHQARSHSGANCELSLNRHWTQTLTRQFHTREIPVRAVTWNWNGDLTGRGCEGLDCGI